MDKIPSPSPSVKIQIMGWKICLRCKGKALMGIVDKLLKTKSLLTSPGSNLIAAPKSNEVYPGLGILQLADCCPSKSLKQCFGL